MVYGVFGGEYSDWYPVGYFENREEAEVFCNRFNEGRGRWDDELYIIAMPNLGINEKEEKPSLVRVDTKTWKWSFAPNDEWVLEGGKDTVFDFGNGDISVFIWIHSFQLDRVVKIAQDFYAKWKAEQEGL